MRSLSRITIVPALALALAAAPVLGPAAAQDYRRPLQNGEMPRPGLPRGAGAPRVDGPRGGGSPRGMGGPRNPVQAPVQAEQRRRGNGAGVAAGVIGGLAAGAILGGILSNRGAAAAGPEVDPDGCPLVRRPVYDGAGRFAGYQTVPSC